MIRLPPRSTRTDTLFPYTTLFRSALLTIAVSQAGAHERKPSDPSALPAGDFGGPFVLMDHSGREVTERTYLGRLQVIYFGYTHCPDICQIGRASWRERVCQYV